MHSRSELPRALQKALLTYNTLHRKKAFENEIRVLEQSSLQTSAAFQETFASPRITAADLYLEDGPDSQSDVKCTLSLLCRGRWIGCGP